MLLTASEIIAKTWHLFATNYKKFVVYMLCLSVPPIFQYSLGLLGVYVSNALPQADMAVNVILLIVIAACLVFVLWASLAITLAAGALVKNGAVPGVKQTFGATGQFIWPAIYTAFFVIVAIIFGALLLIIPGIIFAVWYSFTVYTLVLDGQKGFNALKLSKLLVVGRWWAVLWRLVVPAGLFLFGSILIQIFIMGGLSFVLPDIVSARITTNVVAAIMGGVVAPLTALCGVILYFNAKEVPARLENPLPPTS